METITLLRTFSSRSTLQARNEGLTIRQEGCGVAPQPFTLDHDMVRSEFISGGALADGERQGDSYRRSVVRSF